MCNSADLKGVPDRYISDNRVESVNSYNTFINYYLKDPTPTAKELSDLSGFTVNTCRTWITKNKYKARKKEWIELNRSKENLSIRGVNESILSMLAGLKLNQTIIHKYVVDDVNNRVMGLSELDTLNPVRLELIKENSNIIKDFNNLVNSLWTIDKYDDYLKDNNTNIEDIYIILEELEDKRAKPELEAIDKLYDDYKGVEW